MHSQALLADYDLVLSLVNNPLKFHGTSTMFVSAFVRSHLDYCNYHFFTSLIKLNHVLL